MKTPNNAIKTGKNYSRFFLKLSNCSGVIKYTNINLARSIFMNNFILFHQTIPIAYECFVVESDGVIIDRYAAFEQDPRK